MARLSVPSRYLGKTGIEDAFRSLGGTVSVSTATNGTAVTDTSFSRSGKSSSIKVSLTSGTAFVFIDNSADIDVSKAGGVTAIFYVDPSTFTSFRRIDIFLDNGAGTFANYFIATALRSKCNSGWNAVYIPKSDFTVGAGAPTWDTVSHIRWQVYNEIGLVTTVWLDSLVFGNFCRPKLLITFDGGTSDVYTKAYPYMSLRDIPGSVFVIPKFIGTGGWITLDNMNTMSNAGWAFGHHSYSGLELAGLTDAALKVEIESARDFLISNGFNLSSSFFSYPAGTISSRTKDALIASGGLMARTRSGTAANKNFNYPAPFFCPSEYEQYAYPIGNVSGVAQLTNLKTRITEAINYGSSLWLYLTGTIKTSGVADGDILETEFQQLIDFVVQNRCSIDPVSTVKYYYGLNTSRQRK